MLDRRLHVCDQSKLLNLKGKEKPSSLSIESVDHLLHKSVEIRVGHFASNVEVRERESGAWKLQSEILSLAETTAS